MEERKYIRFGLGAIRGLGEGAAEIIVAERKRGGPYKDLLDFCHRIDLAKVSKKAIEALIKSGAMDSLHPEGNRASMMAVLDSCIERAKTARQNKAAGKRDMFSAMAEKAAAQPIPDEQIEVDLIEFGRAVGLRIGDEKEEERK